MYRDWKSTNNINEYSKKKIYFQTFEKIVDQNIIDAKYFYYHNIFLEQRGDMKKTWATINETLNRSKNRTAFPSNFIINNLSVEDPQEIANHFIRFLFDVGSDLSNKIVVDNASSNFTDYLKHPTNLNFNFNLTTENEILTIINKLKNKNSSGVDDISNKLLKAIKHEIKEPLSVIINQSLRTGIYPD